METSAKKRLWTRTFVVNALTNFFIYLVYFFLMVVMTSYAVDKLHATHSEAGLATGIFVLGALIARVFSGRAVYRLGEKKTLFIGLAIYLATTFLYFPVANLTTLCVVRFLHGIGFGVSATGAGTIAARIIPPERRGEGIGYYALTTTMASAIGPFIAMNLHRSGNFNAILVLSAALLIVTFTVASLLRVPERESRPTAESVRKKVCGIQFGKYFETTAVPISLICALVVVGYSGVLTFISPYTKESELASAGSMFFLVYSLFVLISRLITGRLFDLKGENFITYPAILLFAVGLLMLAEAHEGVYLLAAAAVIGFGYGTFFSCANAIAIKVSRQEKVHLSTSTYFIFADLGAGVGPFLLGAFIPVLGYRGLYIALAVFVLCCIVLYHFAHGMKAAKMKAQA